MTKHITSLFTRDLQINKKNQAYLETLNNVLNLKKLHLWSRRKTYNYYNINFENEYIAYRFQILKIWIEQNQAYNQKFVNSLFEIISILCLEDALTIQEKNFLNEFRSVVFAKNRNIKNLIVSFQLLIKEQVWYTYDILGFFKIVENKNQCLFRHKQIFLSNQRIIVAENEELSFSLDYAQITNIKLKNNMLEIVTKQDIYLVVADEITTLYVSLERVGKLIRKKI